jgi:hypothetical protein
MAGRPTAKKKSIDVKISVKPANLLLERVEETINQIVSIGNDAKIAVAAAMSTEWNVDVN